MAETLRITRGALGPIRRLPEKGLQIFPFTVFVGKQGTGKSLISQLVYFFRDLPFLVRYYETRLGPDAKEEEILRIALDDLRSSRRAFAVFGDPSATVNFTALDGKNLGFRLDSRNRQISPHKSLKQEVARAREKTVRSMKNAIYVSGGNYSAML